MSDEALRNAQLGLLTGGHGSNIVDHNMIVNSAINNHTGNASLMSSNGILTPGKSGLNPTTILQRDLANQQFALPYNSSRSLGAHVTTSPKGGSKSIDVRIEDAQRSKLQSISPIALNVSQGSQHTMISPTIKEKGTIKNW